MTTDKVTKAAQTEATTRKLIDIAREQFATQGYANTATEEIVRLAGVTRGALYHHFGSKEGLFRAVVESVQADIGARVDAAAGASGDAWGELIDGCRAFLMAALDPHARQIVLIDAPAVLGWEAWRAMDEANSMALLRASLAELVAAGILAPLPLDALTRLLSGAMNEAALWIANAPDPDAALDAAMSALEALLSGIRR
jgi:AcrR family transcriptional regulator